MLTAVIVGRTEVWLFRGVWRVDGSAGYSRIRTEQTSAGRWTVTAYREGQEVPDVYEADETRRV